MQLILSKSKGGSQNSKFSQFLFSQIRFEGGGGGHQILKLSQFQICPKLGSRGGGSSNLKRLGNYLCWGPRNLIQLKPCIKSRLTKPKKEMANCLELGSAQPQLVLIIFYFILRIVSGKPCPSCNMLSNMLSNQLFIIHVHFRYIQLAANQG